MLLQAKSAAIASVTEPSAGNPNLVVNLNPDTGLITQKIFYSSTDLSSGAVAGYLEQVTTQQGTGGTAAPLRKVLYTSQTAYGQTIYPISAELSYPKTTTPDDEAPVTTYDYIWQTDAYGNPTFQVQQVTITPPVIAVTTAPGEGQNGTGLPEPTMKVYDSYGNLVWLCNARGFISNFSYDPATGAQVQVIQDVDTSQASNVPEGWMTPVGGGLNLITDYINDLLGRRLRMLRPWIQIDPQTVGAGGDAALPVRPVNYTYYRDASYQVWNARGYLTGDGEATSWQILGPVSLTFMDADGNTTDLIQAPACCPCGPLGPNTFGAGGQLPAQSQWTRWTHTEVDPWGRALETAVYFAIPASGVGYANVNFNATSFGYDVMGRQYLQVSPGGTISQTVFNSRGLPTANWIGTNNTNATPADPSGGGATGNNMQPVSLGVYDDGAAGGDGNLTQATLPVDTNSSNNRVTTYGYDYRDRQIQVNTSDGTNPFIYTYAYDNLNQKIAQARYHNSVAQANLTHYATTAYDDRNRVFQQQKYYVNSDGSLGGALSAATWYDPNNNPIKQTQQGATAVTKTVFDSLDRGQTSYLVSENASTSNENTNSVALDVAINQTERVYNNANQPIATTACARFDDATGTGPLQGPTGSQPLSRNSFVASYLDPIGRLRFTANCGTNGGAPWAYPILHPVPSALILVSEQQYAADGGIAAVIDPAGTVATQQRDQAGRPIQSIGNAAGPLDNQRISGYQYAPDGGLLRLILENLATGQQVTTWAYGTTLATSGVARSDLTVSKTYPTGESASQTYNRQGEVSSMTDPNGSMHVYYRDQLGRLTSDSVPTLAAGVDDWVLCISTAYDLSGRVSTITSLDSPTPGTGDVVNQVALSYNGIDCLTSDAQSHSGAVTGSTPTVGYTCTAAINSQLRRTSVTYPNGRAIGYEYGADGSIFDVLNLVQSVHDTDLTVLAEFAYVGSAMPSVTTLPQPSVQQTWKQLPGEPDGDGGDPYTGYDRFGRTEWMRWIQPSDPGYTDLVNVQWGYNQASLKTWRKDLLAPSSTTQDQAFAYDGLYQVTQRQQGVLNINETAVGGIPAQQENFGYDGTGNWTSYQQANGGALNIDQTRVNNVSNQITQVDGSSTGVAYDDNGNMLLVPTGDDLTGPPYTLVWDAWNRLRQIINNTGSSPTTIAQYQYDGKSRRTQTQIGSLITSPYYDKSWRSVEEHHNRPSNSVYAQYVID